ncbi:MAG: flagellar biosynthesis regulator FlaF [Jhaorihella sp.]
MNAHSQAQRAYSAVSAPTRTARGIEYEALARVTHRLRSAAETGLSGFAGLAAALHDNRRLWCLFAAEAAEPANPLPTDLRARIFYLAEYTQQQSRKVLAGDGSVDSLLDINTAVMRGLRGGEA